MKVTIALLTLLVISQTSWAEEITGMQEKVTGIGGLFFRADNSSELAVWYEKHLGVSLVPGDYEQEPWMQESGPTVFAPFDKETDYFGNAQKVWMINFRVRDIDKMVAQLRDAGVVVELDPQMYPNGRFARLHDPEGNPVELWEPK
jgi:predicted enzyme related to lactoylglutathione lyase